MVYITSKDRIYNIGIEKNLASSILNVVSKWEKSCGIEWTVDRLKNIKLLYINSLSKGNFTQPSSWIGMSKDKHKLLKGPFGTLFKKYQKKHQKILDVLGIYTNYVSTNVTKKQSDKFLHSVIRDESPSIHIKNLKIAADEVLSLLPEYKVFDIRTFVFNPNKMSPNGKGKSVPQHIDLLFEDFKSKNIFDALDDDDLQGVISEHMFKYYVKLAKSEEEFVDGFGDCVGKVSVIQEPGFKARFIANPRITYQISLKSFGKMIFDLIKKIPWDCTYNQQAGVSWTQSQILNGSCCYSVDLSDATNNFPFSIQEKILKWLDVPFDCFQLFKYVCKGKWYIPLYLRKHFENREFIKWSNGQPLGLYPSFPVFALTHGLVLRSCEITCGVSDTFRVLGDDVVISNKQVYDEYINILKLLHVPVSLSKTISSNKIAEFAGCMILKNSYHTVTKWRNPVPQRLLSLLTSLPRTLDLTENSEFVSAIVRSTPLGDNRNSEGLPLKSRIPFFFDFWKQKERKVGFTEFSLSSDMKVYYESRFCQDFNTLPLVKRSDIDDFINSVLESPNFMLCNEIYQYEKKHFSQEKIVSIWNYLLDTFSFERVELPKEIIPELVNTKHGIDIFRKSLQKEFERSTTPINFLKRKFIKSALNWEKLSHNQRLDLIKIISLKFLIEEDNYDK